MCPDRKVPRGQGQTFVNAGVSTEEGKQAPENHAAGRGQARPGPDAGIEASIPATSVNMISPNAAFMWLRSVS